MVRKEGRCTNKKVWNALYKQGKNIIYSQTNKNSTLKFYSHADNSNLDGIIKILSKIKLCQINLFSHKVFIGGFMKCMIV